MKEPIRIKVPSAALSELAGCEWGRWEDAKCPEPSDGWKCKKDEPHDELCACEGTMVAVRVPPIASRYKTILELHSIEEVEEVYYAVCSGTFSRSHWRIANRIADTLRPMVSPELAKAWRAPWDDGGA